VGPTLGLNFGNLDIETVTALKVRTTVTFGGSAEFDLNDIWAIRVEPMYVSKGAKIGQYDPYLGSDEVTFRLNYIDMPVLARLDLGPTDARGYLLGGAAAGFRLGSEAEVKQGTVTEKVDLDEVVRTMDASLVLGAGISFPAGPYRAFLDGRASIGIADINKTGFVTIGGSQVPFDPAAVRNQAFMIVGGLHFPVGD
jgi:hypothetical protein